MTTTDNELKIVRELKAANADLEAKVARLCDILGDISYYALVEVGDDLADKLKMINMAALNASRGDFEFVRKFTEQLTGCRPSG